VIRRDFAANRVKPVSHEMTSLDERLGWLLVVRISVVVLVILAGAFARSIVYYGVLQALPLSAGYLAVAVAAEVYRRGHLWGRMLVHRVVLPLDAVYLALIVTPSGGATSPLIILFAVQLIAVTILGSPRSGLRMALWDSFLLIVIQALSLYSQIGSLLGVSKVEVHNDLDTTLAIMGFWAVAISAAIFSWVSERELRRSKSYISALADMASHLEPITDEEQILGTFLQTLVTAFSFQRGALWCSIESRPIGLTVASPGAQITGIPVPPQAQADRIAVDSKGGSEVQLLRSIDPTENPVAASFLPGATNVVVLGIQIERPTDSYGIVLLEQGGNALKARIPKRTLVLLGQFATHAALVLSNARLLAERERLAAIDGLTGLANRREFDRVLAREVNRSERSQEPVSLAVLDVDHFKSINDTRGHLGGDEVLRAIAEVLKEAVRDMDVAARYGGEEFAVVLPRCDQPDAIRVIERVTVGCAEHPGLVGVTISSGVATLPFNATDGTSLVAAADEALYESKRSGRNRYSVSSREVDRQKRIGLTGTG
jgi:diguanylate cyclase (GGDEF)-like protein